MHGDDGRRRPGPPTAHTHAARRPPFPHAQEAYADLKKEKMSTGDVSAARQRVRAPVLAASHNPSLPTRTRTRTRARPPRAQGYLLVYAITDDTTFGKLDRVREEILRAQGARGAAGGVPIFLVGTKADLAGDRAVSEKERTAKARAWGCKSFEVSAKADTGIGDVFTALITDVLSADASKGSGGGSVLGAGRMPANDLMPAKKKVCAFL